MEPNVPDRQGDDGMNRGFKWSVRFVALTFVLLIVATSYWTVIAGAALNRHPRNPRWTQWEADVIRGGIFASNGEPIVLSDEPKVRHFVGHPSAVHVVGYWDSRFGVSGLEKAYHTELLGANRDASLQRLWAQVRGEPWRGWDVLTTLDMGLQRAAADAMAGRPGAVIAVDPRDGAVLAAYSAPGFHPQRIEEALQPDTSQLSPLFPRGTMGQYPPGSAFKPFVLAAALERGVVRPDELFEDQGRIQLGGKDIENLGGIAHGRIALDDALRLSVNTYFAQLAVTLGGEELLTFAQNVGFGRRPALPIPTAPGHLPDPQSLRDPASTAAIGIGQGELLVTPLQMALAAAAIANGGMRPDPYLVTALRRPGGSIQPVAEPRSKRVLSEGTAHWLREAMIMAVHHGTGSRAALEGTLIAGKTGTAQVDHGPSHAWFIGFAPAQQPTIAVAVVVEHGGYGGETAAPVARALFAQALHSPRLTAPTRTTR